MWEYSYYPSYDYLMHYGVEGMKWGVRRYQNSDGTLTPAGRARYGRTNYNKVQAKKNEYHKAKERYKNYKQSDNIDLNKMNAYKSEAKLAKKYYKAEKKTRNQYYSDKARTADSAIQTVAFGLPAGLITAGTRTTDRILNKTKNVTPTKKALARAASYGQAAMISAGMTALLSEVLNPVTTKTYGVLTDNPITYTNEYGPWVRTYKL